MSVIHVRPDVSDLVFHLYGRPVHPELLSVHARTRVEHASLSASLQICEAGHCVQVDVGGSTLTELTTSRHDPLPTRKRLIDRRLRGQRDQTVECQTGLQYQASFQLEVLDPDVFLKLHEELLLDCRRAKLAFRFPSVNRFAPGPLSVLQADWTGGCLIVHTFHTFPENCAIVRTQSLFEAP